jgi:hypothetical protein
MYLFEHAIIMQYNIFPSEHIAPLSIAFWISTVYDYSLAIPKTLEK